MKSVKNFGGRYSTFSNCNFFSDDSSYSASRCSNSSPLVELSSSPSNHCSGDNIRDDTRSLSAVNLSPLIHTVVSIILMVHTCCLLSIEEATDSACDGYVSSDGSVINLRSDGWRIR